MIVAIAIIIIGAIAVMFVYYGNNDNDSPSGTGFGQDLNPTETNDSNKSGPDDSNEPESPKSPSSVGDVIIATPGKGGGNNRPAYNITLNTIANGGTTPDYDVTYYKGTIPVHTDTNKVPVPVHPDSLTFAGWYKDPDYGSDKWNDGVDALTAPITLYAKWEMPITLDASKYGGNGGNQVLTTFLTGDTLADHLYDSNDVLVFTDLKKHTNVDPTGTTSGKFNGWYQSSDFGTSFSASDIILEADEASTRITRTPSGNTLYARWNLEMSVYGNQFGGAGTAAETISKLTGDTVSFTDVLGTNDVKTHTSLSSIDANLWQGTGSPVTFNNAWITATKLDNDQVFYTRWEVPVAWDATKYGGTGSSSASGNKVLTGDLWSSGLPSSSPAHTSLTSFANWYTSSDSGVTFATLPYTDAKLSAEPATVYARWEVPVAWDATKYGGTGSSSASGNKVLTGDLWSSGLPSSSPAHTSLTSFANWYTSSDSGVTFATLPYTDAKLSAEPATVYARWQAPVTWKVNHFGGSTVDYTQSNLLTGDTLALPTFSNAVHSKGLTFDGWYTAADGGIKHTSVTTISGLTDASGKLIDSSTAAAYARWQAPVTWQVNHFGGSYNIVESSKLTGDVLTLPATATHSQNLIFDGWYTAADSGTKLTDAKSISDLTDGDGKLIGSSTTAAYARWKAHANYYFNAPTSPAYSGTASTYFTDYATYLTGSKISSLPTYTDVISNWSANVSNVDSSAVLKDDQNKKWTFEGWSESDTGAVVSTTSAVDKNMTLYANWTLHNAIKVNDNTGDSAPYTFKTVYATTTSNLTYNISEAGITTTQINTDLAGWTKLKSDTSSLSDITFSSPNMVFTTAPSNNAEYHTRWNYTLIKNADYVGPADVTQKVLTDAPVSLTNPFARSGYDFKGWNNSSGGTGIDYLATATPSFKELKILYAVWDPVAVTLTYDFNGGSGTIAPGSATYGSPVTLSDGSGFTKLGHTVTSWNTYADGTGTSYSLGPAITTSAFTDNTRLYAIWEPATVTLTFDAGTGTANPLFTKDATYGSAVVLPEPGDSGINNVYSKVGYNLSGWSSAPNGGGIFYSNGESIDPSMFETDTTLYAVWTPNQYGVTIDGNNVDTFDGESITVIVVYYDSSIEDLISAIENEIDTPFGADKITLNTQADGTGISYESKDVCDGSEYLYLIRTSI
ncbi:InlB B-repeat-containing protein [Methanimicrococcus blatticola]|nr:InlB B-repeat-containing protein [Methanimicrococcus blatticola]